MNPGQTAPNDTSDYRYIAIVAFADVTLLIGKFQAFSWA